jgi:hypothetical protein
MTTIYGLVDPRSGAVRYVGKTVNPRDRFTSHCRPSAKLPNVRAWVAELHSQGLKPTLEVLERVHQADSDASEMRWIATVSARGEPLLNHTAGGNGGRTPLPAEERSGRIFPLRLWQTDIDKMDAIAKESGLSKAAIMRAALRHLRDDPQARARLRERRAP